METNPHTEAAESWEEISSRDLSQRHRCPDGQTDPAAEESPESPADGEEVVKRLMTDPLDLCCPLSGRLMEDPVVFGDGITYERSWVEERLAQAPGKSPSTGHGIETAVLLPNKHMKSLIVSFKTETIKEILFVVPSLSADQSEQLVKRGEDFIRPNLPNASLTKQLARSCLSVEIHQHILDQEDGSDVEKLYLQLALASEEDIPRDVLSKLTLPAHHLSQCSPSQLMLLAKQLSRSSNRPRDAARVAVVAAKAFASRGKEKESAEAFLQAFALDPFNPDAAEGVTRLASSARKLRSSKKMEECCEELGKDLQAQTLQAWILELTRSPFSWLILAGILCILLGMIALKMLQDSQVTQELEPVVWDLSGYDFTNWDKNQEQKSKKFQLASGINAWFSIYPQGQQDSDDGNAAVYLHVDQPAVVQWSMQSQSSKAHTCMATFNTGLHKNDECGCDWLAQHPPPHGPFRGCGWDNFMPVSDANGRITVNFLSVQPKGSMNILT